MLETAIWGTNPTGWLYDRFWLALLTIYFGFHIARRYVADAIAIAAAVAVVIGPQAEAWYRFGPQEAYATPLLLLAILAMLEGRVRLALATAVVMALTKEPFVPAAILVVVWAWQRGERRWAIAAAVPIALTAAVVGYLVLATSTLATRDFSGRYLLPWLIAAIALAVLVGRRRPRLAFATLAVWIVFSIAPMVTAAASWAALDRNFAGDMIDVRGSVAEHPGVSLLVEAGVSEYELANSFRTWVPDGQAELEVTPSPGLLSDQLVELGARGGLGYAPMGSLPGPHLVIRLYDSTRLTVVGLY